MNWFASQSRSSGWVGLVPSNPKLSGVGTIPLPKCQRQTRLTITREVSGFEGEAIQFASSSLPLDFSEKAGALALAKTTGTALGITLPNRSVLPRIWIATSVTFPSVTPIALGSSGAVFSKATVASRNFLRLALGSSLSSASISLGVSFFSEAKALRCSSKKSSAFFFDSATLAVYSFNCAVSFSFASGFSFHFAIVTKLSIVLVLLNTPASE